MTTATHLWPPLPIDDGARDLTLGELFERSAQAHPDLCALRWAEGRSLTYAELEREVAAFASRIAGASRVAIVNDRSPALAVAVLATAWIGAAYIPMDRSYPDNRLSYMLADSDADVVVCPAGFDRSLRVPHGCRVVETTPQQPAAQTVQGTPRAAVQPDQLAYISYTSGSTGLPKGVAMPHRALVNLALWQAGFSRARPGWRTLQLMPLSIDISFQEMFTTWATGGTVVLIDEQTRTDPTQLLKFLDREEINRFFAPFVMLQEIVGTARRQGLYPSALREVITLGEQLQVGEDLKEFFRRTGATLENQYGATETHVVTVERLPRDIDEWVTLPPVGRAITNSRVEVVDSQLRAVADGTEGEIAISGVCVADGYIGKPELTATRFIDLPDTDPRGRIYLTGDFGRVLPSGSIQYLGRRDNQVKVNGLRVEIGEVESQLREQPHVVDAVVTTRVSAEHGNDLVAHCVVDTQTPHAAADLSASLADILPSHMIPAEFKFYRRLPFTPAGKVDRQALSVVAHIPTDGPTPGDTHG